MAALNKRLWDKFVLAAFVNVAAVAPSYAYTLNHQPYYSMSDDNVVDNAQAPSQVLDNTSYAGQVETRNQQTADKAHAAHDAQNQVNPQDDPIVDPVLMSAEEGMPQAVKASYNPASDNAAQAPAKMSAAANMAAMLGEDVSNVPAAQAGTAKPTAVNQAAANANPTGSKAVPGSAAATMAAMLGENVEQPSASNPARNAQASAQTSVSAQTSGLAQQSGSAQAKASHTQTAQAQASHQSKNSEQSPSTHSPRQAETQPANPSTPAYARNGSANNGAASAAAHLAQSNNGSYVIPRPQFNVDYAPRDVKVYMQSNAYVDVEGTKGQSDKHAADYDKRVMSSLMARNVDPSQMSLESLKEQRLSLYDLDKWKDDQAKRDSNPFGDLYALDDVYQSIPEGATAYYIRSDIDQAKFLKIMSSSLDRYLKEYELGITILDDRGLVALYNNNDFPLEGICALELAYVTGTAMNRLGDTIDMVLRYNATELNRAVYSPFATLVFQNVQKRLKEIEAEAKAKAAAEANGEEYEPPVNNQPQPVVAKVVQLAERSEGFELPTFYASPEDAENEPAPSHRYASAAQNNSLIQDVAVSDTFHKSEVDLVKEWNQSEARNKDRFSEKLNVYTTSPIKTLLYYSLNYDDTNAADLLLSYLGSVTSLNFELSSKGIKHTRYNVLTSDVQQSPELNYHNFSPLFDMAKQYATYIKDPEFPSEVRDVIDSALDNDLNEKHGIYRGITNAIRKDSPDDRSTLQVHSIAGLSGFGPRSYKGVATEVAFVKYKGERFIIAIGLKGVPGRDISSLRNDSEKYIAFTASNMFNLLRETYPFLKTNNQLVIPVEQLKIDQEYSN